MVLRATRTDGSTSSCRPPAPRVAAPTRSNCSPPDGRPAFQGDPDFVRDGRVTEHGMSEMRSRMPYADLSAFDQDRCLTVVPHLFTVGLVALYIAWKLGQCVEAGPNGAGAV